MIVAVIGTCLLLASMAQDFSIGIAVGALLILVGGLLLDMTRLP